jgi:oligosaccharide repeat unit polymerase
MQVLLIVGSLFIAFASYFKEKNAYNPVTIIFSIWTITIFLASIRLFGIYEASDFTYYIIFVGLMSFLIGYYFLGPFGRRRKNESRIYTGNKTFTRNTTIIYILMAVAFVILSKTAVNSLYLLLQGNQLDYIRYSARNDIMSSNAVAYVYIAQPIVNLMICISALNFYSKEKNKIIFWGTVVLTLLTILSEGGRFLLLYYIINYVYAAILVGRKFKLKKKDKKRLRVIILLVFAIIIYITISRGSNLVASFYVYICGSIPHLSQKVVYLDNMNTYTWGVASYQGFIRPIFTFLRNLGIISDLPFLVSMAEILTLEVEKPVSISDGSNFNGFITMFYYFYADFGILGVAIGSIIYGYLCRSVYSKVKHGLINTNVVVYLLFIQTMYLSIVRYQFSSYMFALSFVYLIFTKYSVKIK